MALIIIFVGFDDELLKMPTQSIHDGVLIIFVGFDEEVLKLPKVDRTLIL